MLFYHKFPENFIPELHNYPQITGIRDGRVYWHSFKKVLKGHGIFTNQSTLFMDIEEYLPSCVWMDLYEDYEDLFISEDAIIGRSR